MCWWQVTPANCVSRGLSSVALWSLLYVSFFCHVQPLLCTSCTVCTDPFPVELNSSRTDIPLCPLQLTYIPCHVSHTKPLATREVTALHWKMWGMKLNACANMYVCVYPLGSLSYTKWHALAGCWGTYTACVFCIHSLRVRTWHCWTWQLLLHKCIVSYH